MRIAVAWLGCCHITICTADVALLPQQKTKMGKLRYLSKNILSGCSSRMLRNGQTVRKTTYIYKHTSYKNGWKKNPLNCKMNSLFSAQMDLTHGATSCSAHRSDVPVLLIELFWKPSESPDAAGETSADLAADLGSVCCGPAMMILEPFFDEVRIMARFFSHWRMNQCGMKKRISSPFPLLITPPHTAP